MNNFGTSDSFSSRSFLPLYFVDINARHSVKLGARFSYSRLYSDANHNLFRGFQSGQQARVGGGGALRGGAGPRARHGGHRAHRAGHEVRGGRRDHPGVSTDRLHVLYDWEWYYDTSNTHCLFLKLASFKPRYLPSVLSSLNIIQSKYASI